MIFKKMAICILIGIFTLFLSCEKKKEEVKEEGVFIIKEGNKYGFSGYLNGKKIYIEPRFTFANKFSEGLAVVELDGKMGYVDYSGKLVISNRFDMAYDFSDGLGRVMVSRKFGFINRKGEIVIGLIYDDATDFRNGMAYVFVGKSRIKIDQEGNIIPSYTNTNFFYNPKNY